jgi:DNA polymerase-3 subunit delta'
VPFRDIVGHRRITALLSRAIARDTLPQSLLLAGPAGVGKRRIARAAAEATNCLDPRADGDFERDACGVCAACRRIARDVHPDVVTLAPGDTGTIKIDDVRVVIDKAGYRPFEGRRRVVIIDEADSLVPQAQNALLKTLEEPPSASTFLLVSSVPDALLATVRSRCPRLRFGTLTASDVAAVLVRDHEYTDVDARAAAVDADGSVGRALAIASADLIEAREVATRLLQQAARSGDPVRRIEAVKELAPKKGSSANEREQLAACLRVMASLLRDVGMLSAQVDRRLLSNPDLEADLQRLVSAYAGERSDKVFTAIDRALGALERNASPKIVADWLALEL